MLRKQVYIKVYKYTNTHIHTYTYTYIYIYIYIKNNKKRAIAKSKMKIAKQEPFNSLKMKFITEKKSFETQPPSPVVEV